MQKSLVSSSNLVAVCFCWHNLRRCFFGQLNVYHLGASLMGIDRAERWLTAWQLLQLAERSQAESNLPEKPREEVESDFKELLFVFLGLRIWKMNFVKRNTEILLISFLISISFSIDLCDISCSRCSRKICWLLLLTIGTEQYKAPAVCSECCQGLVAYGSWPTARDARSESCRPAQQKKQHQIHHVLRVSKKSGKASKQLEKHWRDDVCWCLLMSADVKSILIFLLRSATLSSPTLPLVPAKKAHWLLP